MQRQHDYGNFRHNVTKPRLVGPVLEDRPPLAKDRVRYFGEPIAIVVADNMAKAKEAAGLVNVEYEPLLQVMMAPAG